MAVALDTNGPNRKGYWSLQKDLYSKADCSYQQGKGEARFWLHAIPKSNEVKLMMPDIPTDPDADGSRWILEKAGAGPEGLAKLQKILEEQLKQPPNVADISGYWFCESSDADDFSIYLSALIVEDDSRSVKDSIRSGLSEKALEHLMKDSTLAECRDADNLSCIEVAASSGNLKVLRALINQDRQRLDRTIPTSQNLLHHAATAKRPNVDVIEFLCSHNEVSFAEQRDSSEFTPLQVALGQAVLENVKCLLPYTKGHLEASGSGKGEPATCTAIRSEMLAAWDRLVPTLRLLLQSIPVDSQDFRGCTALRHAIGHEAYGACELLLRDFQADPNVRDFHGTTPIACACEKADISFLRGIEKECKIPIDWWSIDEDGDSLICLAQTNSDPQVEEFVATMTNNDSRALQALEAFEDNHIVCADIHTSMKNYDAAIERLQQADPQVHTAQRIQICHKIARLKLLANDPEAAETLLNQPLGVSGMHHGPSESEPDYDIPVASVHRTLARAYIMQNRYAAALNSIETALAIEARTRERECLLNLHRQTCKAKGESRRLASRL